MSIKMHFLANEIVGFVSTPIYFRCRRETWAEFVWIVSIVLAAVLEGTQFRELVDGWKDGFWCKSQSNLSALGKRRRVVMLAQPGEKARECLLIITGSKGPKDSTARACKGEGWKTLWILHLCGSPALFVDAEFTCIFQFNSVLFDDKLIDLGFIIVIMNPKVAQKLMLRQYDFQSCSPISSIKIIVKFWQCSSSCIEQCSRIIRVERVEWRAQILELFIHFSLAFPATWNLYCSPKQMWAWKQKLPHKSLHTFLHC